MGITTDKGNMDLSKVDFVDTCKGCAKGIDMCKTTPCWGTPAEMTALKIAGYGSRLSVDMRDGIRLVVPRAEAGGRCTFLDRQDQCELHSRGLKPVEGRGACCKISPLENVRDGIIDSWRDHQHEAHI